MHRRLFHLYRGILVGGWLFFSVGHAAIASPCVAPSRDFQVGRYQSITIGTEAVQLNLLANVITHEFPDDVHTIGEAVHDLLESTGYRLLNAELAATERVHLFALPLPDVQRRLGPLTLQEALELLSGEAFRLVVDPVYQLVSFELMDPIAESEGDAGHP
jgi:conjugative transfer region protein (TIGR03748 family)